MGSLELSILLFGIGFLRVWLKPSKEASSEGICIGDSIGPMVSPLHLPPLLIDPDKGTQMSLVDDSTSSQIDPLGDD